MDKRIDTFMQRLSIVKGSKPNYAIIGGSMESIKFPKQYCNNPNTAASVVNANTDITFL